MVYSGDLSRRAFLRLGGVGLTGVVLAGSFGCGGSGGETGRVVFSFGPEQTGTLRQLVDDFNEQRGGEIEVEWREMPADSSQYFDQLRTEFQAGGGDIDVIGGDVIWPAQFAANGWILDLSDRLPENARADYLDSCVEAVTYEGGIYGMPWYINAGMLYYRADLLEESGFSEPPATWEELKEMALKVREDAGIENGFVFQGAGYEGGVVNALEYIWTHGGDVLDPDDPSRVIINSPETVEGLRMERSMIEEGVSPQSVTAFMEQESQALFLQGDAVFMRNWPYVYGLLGDESESNVTPEQVGVSALPTASPEQQSASCLGGWNLFVNAASQNQEAAWTFIEYLAGAEQQKWRAIEGAFLPSLRELYEDPEVREGVPVVELGREAIENTRSRPVSPFYSDMSLVMAEEFNATLRGDSSPEETAEKLQTELEDIVERGGA